MKYEAPELTALTAIDAIQSSFQKGSIGPLDSVPHNELSAAYADWE